MPAFNVKKKQHLLSFVSVFLHVKSLGFNQPDSRIFSHNNAEPLWTKQERFLSRLTSFHAITTAETTFNAVVTLCFCWVSHQTSNDPNVFGKQRGQAREGAGGPQTSPLNNVYENDSLEMTVMLGFNMFFKAFKSTNLIDTTKSTKTGS